MPELIIASASEARARMFSRAGLAYTKVPARIDEPALRASLTAVGASPRELADALAEAKAAKISARHPTALVVGADQVLDLDGECLAKVETPDQLREQLRRLSGRRHRLWSAAVVAEAGTPVWRHVGEAGMHMRNLSDEWLESYVSRNWDAVRESVGGYLIEGEGVRLFDRIDGDTFTVMGLPLIPLLSWLTLRGSISG